MEYNLGLRKDDPNGEVTVSRGSSVHYMPTPANQDDKQTKKNNSYFFKSNILYLCLNS